MSPNPKKEIERQHLDLFAKLLGEPIEVVEDDRESPDFIVEHRGRRVGIEVAMLEHEGMAAAHAEPLRQEMSAELLGHARGLGRHIGASLFTGPNFSGFKTQDSRLEFLSRMKALMSDALAKPPPVDRWYSDDDLAPWGFRELWCASVADIPGIYPDYVDIRPFTEFTGGDRARALDVLRAKEAKLDRYRANSGTPLQWLLMITGASVTQVVVADMLGREPVESTFDRVFVLDVRLRHLQVLKNSLERRQV